MGNSAGGNSTGGNSAGGQLYRGATLGILVFFLNGSSILSPWGDIGGQLNELKTSLVKLCE